MKHTARNDPCPCRSGKKYKKCCLSAVEASDSAYRRKDRIEGDLMLPLVDYALETFGDESRREAWDIFNGIEGVELPDEDSPINLIFIPWYLFSCPFENVDSPRDPPVTIAETFWLENEDELTEDEISYLDAAIGLPYSFYELLEVRPAVGLKLRDLFTHKELNVVEPALEGSFEPGGILYGAIMEFGNFNWILALAPLPLATDFKTTVLEFRNALTELLGRDELTEMDLIDFEKEIRSLYFALMFQMADEEVDEEAFEPINPVDEAELESMPLLRKGR
jgi:SEC-C motif